MLSKALFKSLVKLKIHKKVPLKRHLERMATVMLTYKGQGTEHCQCRIHPLKPEGSFSKPIGSLLYQSTSAVMNHYGMSLYSSHVVLVRSSPDATSLAVRQKLYIKWL